MYTGCILCRCTRGFLTIMDRQLGILKKRKNTCFFILNGQFFYNNFKNFNQAVVSTSKSTFFFQIVTTIFRLKINIYAIHSL